MRSHVRRRLSGRVVILDGAMGTELQARGMPPGVSPEVHALESPDVVRDIHARYVLSGADVVYTCTFGANRYKLAQYGTFDIALVNRTLAGLARQASGGKSLVAGDIGPTGRFVEPFGDLGFEDAVSCFKEQVQGLLEGGVDLFVIETMMDIQEARAALVAIREITDAFCMVSLTYDEAGRTLTGTDPATAVVTLQALGADAVGCNCSAGPAEMVRLVEAMRPYARVPILAKPNAGLPRLKDTKTAFDMGPVEFARHARELVRAGASMVGGCCGTTPGHIARLRDEVRVLEPPKSVPRGRPVLSSVSARVELVKDGPLVVIGERINPTGKKALQEELRQGIFSLVCSFAREQALRGAEILDVNVGMPGIDEKFVLREAVKRVVLCCDRPLCIDTTRIDALEAALRIYPGRALVNSISGEEETLEERLRIASRYGAMFILLPVTGSSLPKTARDRARIARSVFGRARPYGFTKDDVIVDALTMAVSAQGDAALETLETIRWSSRVFRCASVVGLSNVSFGLPERKWVNAAFLAMAGAMGLTCAIANPEVPEIMNVKFALDVLRGRDPDARAYITRFGDVSSPNTPAPDPSSGGRTPRDGVARAIVEGDREAIRGLVEKALEDGCDPRELVDEVMIPAIRQVGDLYERKIYFLPQLIASAESMKRGFEVLEPLLAGKGGVAADKGRIVIATVKGDIHDIGKNIVALLLRNNGFSVEDLGKDVPADVIVDAARRLGADIVALSALMTTTMASMEETVRVLRGAGISSEVLVGGAVVTEGFASSIGARYAKDGVEAVREAERVMAEKDRSE